ncbi:MAG: glycosyltransferase [Actinomycetota bacterium]
MPSEADHAPPRVTIVVTARERFSQSRESLASIYAHTTVPFELTYVIGKPPAELAGWLTDQAAARGFDLVIEDEHLAPTHARIIAMKRVTTPYVVFVDNDLIVNEGWLACLLECAVETGAWVVGPLYYESEDDERVIHMAGGDLELTGEWGHRTCATGHRHQGVALDDCPVELVREPVDFVEFHCLLMPTAALDRIGGLDPGFLSSREHIDLCLAVDAAGGTTWLEPASEVTYLKPPPIERGDVSFFLRRWSERWNEASLEHFCTKYGIDPAYTERRVSMRARRQVLLRPVERLSRRVLPGPLHRFAWRVVARLEREANSLLFRVPSGV